MTSLTSRPRVSPGDGVWTGGGVAGRTWTWFLRTGRRVHTDCESWVWWGTGCEGSASLVSGPAIPPPLVTSASSSASCDSGLDRSKVAAALQGISSSGLSGLHAQSFPEPETHEGALWGPEEPPPPADGQGDPRSLLTKLSMEVRGWPGGPREHAA